MVILLTEKRGRGTGRFFLSFSFLPFFFRNETFTNEPCHTTSLLFASQLFPLLRISKLVYTLYIDRLTTTLKRISSPPSSIRTYYCDYKYFSGRR